MTIQFLQNFEKMNYKSQSIRDKVKTYETKPRIDGIKSKCMRHIVVISTDLRQRYQSAIELLL